MVRILFSNFTGRMGSNHTLYACPKMLSFITFKQDSQTVVCCVDIIKNKKNQLLTNSKSSVPNVNQRLTRCYEHRTKVDKKKEKKSLIALDFHLFFVIDCPLSNVNTSSEKREANVKEIIVIYQTKKRYYENFIFPCPSASHTLQRNRPNGFLLLWELSCFSGSSEGGNATEFGGCIS